MFRPDNARLRSLVVVQFDSLSLWERVGVRAWAQTNHNLAAGFSPQSVQGFFTASTALKNDWWLVLITG